MVGLEQVRFIATLTAMVGLLFTVAGLASGHVTDYAPVLLIGGIVGIMAAR